MKRALIAILFAAGLRAAVIRGTVVENFTGKALSGAQVTLQSLSGGSVAARWVRTSRLGGFEFDGLPAGVYLLKASRRGFLPAEYGQKRWNSAGQSIVLEETASTFLNVRLLRYGAIAGALLDDNDIGLQGHDVMAYRVAEPPEPLVQATTDDRGVYRIGGLLPGRYVVASLGREYDEGSYVPTFAKEARTFDQAQVAEVLPDQQTDRVDIRPALGRTLRLTAALAQDPDEPVTLTLASRSGLKTVQAASYTFTGLTPDSYEVYAEWGDPKQTSYERVTVGGDTTVTLLRHPPGVVMVAGAPASDPGLLLARRRDLAGPGEPFRIPLARGRGELPSGRWELLLQPPAGYYVSAAWGGASRDRPDQWIEVLSRPYSSVRFTVTAGPGSIHGVVKDGAYAPVYLEPYDSVARKRAGDLQAARADAQGRYRFEGLAPGSYRLVSTYEYLKPDSATIDLAPPAGVELEPHAAVEKDLELWTIR